MGAIVIVNCQRAAVMRMRRVVVAIMPVAMRIMSLVGVMMPERHALAGHHGCHALDRNGEGQKRERENAENFTHRQSLYARRFEHDPCRRFAHVAYFLRERHIAV
jgi:hypothetical protein